ncbi:AbrB/MazE/SpoVT family DNA-binding domain-containing protein [Desulfofustis glycolicus]|uniref:Looped-hinge helix DNA binding domain-containing protein, AbrB family n=1 Tax=Desulfofustis glycolicus DSM 9705 TaxID=1121409 RepID=A0A1M5VQ36_9BACT|nr:AbrB/MazE/SpoVT family DNA-binding domain-containing protein [Desulfofustis glycolicus]MCB2216801.1 AbrB/MazE/SpoVT family DNA-binding domain-containing protein [Desulfobulbaceae bacterium]SHH77376.1 looped-hinge helix DNA binding domain-containing protein, AbrB family [Desulfofustis glycolicus DSM 9705]
MRVTSKGQVTIPVEIRERMGIFANSEVDFVVQGNLVILQKASGSTQRGKRIVERMRGRATIRMSTDDIMALTRGED